MSRKFWFLTNESFKKKARSKWFVIVNIILLIAIVAVFNIDRIITMFGGDFDDTKEIVVIDQTGSAYPIFKSQLDSLDTLLDVSFDINASLTQDDIDSVKTRVQESDEVLIVLESDSSTDLKASVMSSSYIDTTYYQYLYQALNNTKMALSFQNSSMTEEEYARLTSSVSIDRVILGDDATSEEEMMNMIMGTVFPTVILPFFILVVFLIQMIGSEINEEKQNRCMEIIISNVSPKVHFFSKILAGNAFVFLQAFLLILYAGIGLFIRNLSGGLSLGGELGTYATGILTTLTESGLLSQFAYIIPLTILLMLLSFVAYSLVAGILASMTVSMEDFQQIQTPIMFICMIGYYLSIMSGVFHGSVFIRVLSYVPFLSSLLSPALLITGQIGLIDVFISVGILILFNYFLIRYGLRIYKIGILNYSTDKMWSKIFKAAREK